MKTRTLRGFKFLNPYGATNYNNQEAYYPLPSDNSWGPWLDHPAPAQPNTDVRQDDCGPGRWHVMKFLDSIFAPTRWWPWFAEGRGIVGESDVKFGCTSIRLRRITERTFWKILKLGYCKGHNLQSAPLRNSSIDGADLTNSNLYKSDFSYASARRVNLTDTAGTAINAFCAHFNNAIFRGARWQYSTMADVIAIKADFSESTFAYANFLHAHMPGANFSGADLGDANFSYANLVGANFEGATIRGANFTGASLRRAKLPTGFREETTT